MGYDHEQLMDRLGLAMDAAETLTKKTALNFITDLVWLAANDPCPHARVMYVELAHQVANTCRRKGWRFAPSADRAWFAYKLGNRQDRLAREWGE